MIGPPLVDLSRFPGWWSGGAVSELAKLRAQAKQMQRAIDWRDRRIGDLELRLRGAPPPPSDVLAHWRKRAIVAEGIVSALRGALEGWGRPHT